MINPCIPQASLPCHPRTHSHRDNGTLFKTDLLNCFYQPANNPGWGGGGWGHLANAEAKLQLRTLHSLGGLELSTALAKGLQERFYALFWKVNLIIPVQVQNLGMYTRMSQWIPLPWLRPSNYFCKDEKAWYPFSPGSIYFCFWNSSLSLFRSLIATAR